MRIQGAERNGKYSFKCNGIEVHLNQLSFKTIRDLENCIPTPKAKTKKVQVVGGGFRDEEIITDEYLEAVRDANMLRLAVVFYLSLDDANIEFDVERRDISTIDIEWAEDLFDELENYFTFEQFSGLAELLTKKLGINIEEAKDEGKDAFLSKTS